MRYIWIPLVALSAACSQSERATGPSAIATGAGPQAFSIADQPCIGNAAISRPTDAPTELRAAQGGQSVVVLEWRARCNAVRWQVEISRHDPTDQPFFEAHTADGRPFFEFRPAANLVGRTFNWRVRAAWPDGAVGNWATGEPFTFSAAPAVAGPAPKPINPWNVAKRDCEDAGGVFNENVCTFDEETQPWPVE